MPLVVLALIVLVSGGTCSSQSDSSLNEIHHGFADYLTLDSALFHLTSLFQPSVRQNGDVTELGPLNAALDVNVTKDCPAGYVDEIVSRLSNVSEECRVASVQTMVDFNCSPKERYAVKMYDAMGKLESNVLRGDLRWFGSMQECREVVDVPVNLSTSSPASSFNAQYCVATCVIPRSSSFDIPVQLGVCVPDVCTQEELLTVVSLGLDLRPLGVLFKRLNVIDVYCEYDDPITTEAIVVIAVIGFVVMLVAVATIVDYVKRKNRVTIEITSEKEASIKVTSSGEDNKENDNHEDSNQNNVDVTNKDKHDDIYDVIEECEHDNKSETATQPDKTESQSRDIERPKSNPLRAFSLITSGSRILSTDYDNESQTISAVYGMKFLTMMWVFYGMNYEVSITLSINFTDYAGASIIAQPIGDPSMSTDTYLLISGMLVTYQTLMALKQNIKVNWLVFLFKKLWRFGPSYYIVLFVYMYCLVYVCQGPMQFMVERYVAPCYDYWWTNLLYIQNLYPYLDPIRKRCMGWSWHICLLMQYFIISPFIIMALHWKKSVGFLIIGLLFAMDFVSTGLISWYYGLPPVGGLAYYNDNADDAPFADYLYSKPHTRISSYLVGMCLGYILVHHKRGKNMHWFFQVVCWLLSTAGFWMVYAKYWAATGDPWTHTMTVLFYTFSRFIYSVAVAWCLFACATGIAGPINRFLSWRFFVPMSRLTYCVYLIHPLVMIKFWTGAESQMFVSDLNYLYLFISHLIFSYFVAFFLAILFERPFIQFEKAVFGRCYSTKPRS